MLPVLDSQQNFALRAAIAGNVAGEDDPWHVLAASKQCAEDLCPGGSRCSFVAPALDQDIQHVAVLINRTPEVGRFALDGQKNFIDVPRIARPRTTATQRVGVLLPKLRGMC